MLGISGNIALKTICLRLPFSNQRPTEGTFMFPHQVLLFVKRRQTFKTGRAGGKIKNIFKELEATLLLSMPVEGKSWQKERKKTFLGTTFHKNPICGIINLNCPLMRSTTQISVSVEILNNWWDNPQSDSGKCYWDQVNLWVCLWEII